MDSTEDQAEYNSDGLPMKMTVKDFIGKYNKVSTAS
jgi:hypothetical protein